MSKPEASKKDTFIDMTAMSDVTVLLLTFFMLTATFMPVEPVQVVAPSSVIETKVPEVNLMTVLIDPEGKVFLNLDRAEDKVRLLDRMGERYKIEFTNAEKRAFAETATFVGTPIGGMKEYLAVPTSEHQGYLRRFNGIPTDSTNNQLALWIEEAKKVNEHLTISIKADRDTPYPLIRNVTSTLQDIKENRFVLVTSLRGMPSEEGEE